MTLRYQLRTVDVFTERALAGNQLAVVLGAEGITSDEMQAIAREMNLSETTFVLPPEQPGAAARVRIFTPTAELPFAGHPTIGTAWVLWTEGLVPRTTQDFVLQEKVGAIPVRVGREPRHPLVWMTHPAVTFGEVIGERAQLAEALGLRAGDLVADVPVQAASTGVPFLFVALNDARAVDTALSSAERLGSFFHGREPHPVFLFAALGGARLYSRMFAPHLFQIAEDAATGSASGPLGAFAVRYQLVPRSASVSIVSEQGTKMGRQSFVHIRLSYPPGADVPSRIEVGGAVVPVITGELSIRNDTESR
jgi:trans-2,3-dihydro-3-hydroxyanthranilate isomerase